MLRRLVVPFVAVTIALPACGGGDGRRPDSQAKLPAEKEAVGDSGNADCAERLPSPAPGVVPPGGTPFLERTVWIEDERAAGSLVRRGYAPGNSPKEAADDLVEVIRRAGLDVTGNNAEGGTRATVTYADRGSDISVIITQLCRGFVLLSYHFPDEGTVSPTPSS